MRKNFAEAHLAEIESGFAGESYAIDDPDAGLYTPEEWREKFGTGTKDETGSTAAVADIRTGKPRLTQDVLEKHLSGIGVEVSYNLISHDIIFKGAAELWPKLNPESYADKVPLKLRDQLADTFKGATVAEISDLLGLIADEHSVNPVLELIAAEPWDGTKRGALVESALRLDDDLSKVLVGKWFLQGIALLNNTIFRNYSADGVLVLQGTQGIGKTSFGRLISINPEWFKDGAKLVSRDKDTLIQTTGYWISELGEVEATFRASDIESLKGFITSPVDEYRLPYGHTATRHPRRTNIFATCNSADFLVDKTGNRRFWTIPLPNGVDIPALEKLDVLQLWREYYHYWRQYDAKGRGGTCYRLTAEERALLEERNALYRASVPGQPEVEAILADVGEHPELYEWKPTNLSDWMERHPVFAERRLSSVTVGKALAACGIERHSFRAGVKTFKGYQLPVPR